MITLQCQQHVAARGEQRHIAFAEKHHPVASLHLLSQSGSSGPPGVLECRAIRHHRKNQGQPPLFRPEIGLHDRNGHPRCFHAGHRIRNHVSRPQQAVGLEG